MIVQQRMLNSLPCRFYEKWQHYVTIILWKTRFPFPGTEPVYTIIWLVFKENPTIQTPALSNFACELRNNLVIVRTFRKYYYCYI